MHQEILQSPPWSFYEEIDSSTFDHQVAESYSFTMNNHVDIDDYVPYSIIMDDHVNDYELNTSSEVFSTSFPSTSTIYINDHIHHPIDEETLQLPSLMELDPIDSILSPQVYPIYDHIYQEESDSQNFPSVINQDAWSPTLSMKSELSSNQQSLILPQEEMEIDNKVILPHMMEACGEALEKGQKSLGEVTLKCMSQKVSPLGESLETLAFYLSQEVTNHGDYLKGEAFKNLVDAFKVIYQLHPIGKVAHFAAILAILEAAILEDCDSIHIIDSCIGNGIQWPPLFEAIAKMNKIVKLTSIKWGDENSSPWNFEETKSQLYEHAKSCGLKLKVEEKGLEELVIEIKRMNKRGRKKELLAFNLMYDLPHMGILRSKRQHALEFLKVAEDLIKNSQTKGIIIFGDGDPFEKLKNSLNFSSFFEGHLMHYKALMESIESHFTSQFSEARIACEVLFVAPSISSHAWLQTWEEMKMDYGHLKGEITIKGSRLSENIMMEVREVLRESCSSYQARIEGQNDNEFVLEWKETQLLRFSIWKN